MTELEVAECPVCLQSFDDDVAIPRVLGCGHSVCEACLKQLPQPFPDTLRCPACTQLVKIPPQGPSALPKNIDLLRLTHSAPPLNPHTRSLHNPTTSFMPHLWPPNFDSAWKDWVLPEGSVHPASSTITPPLSSSRPAFASRVIKDNQKVSLVRITMLSPESDSLLQLSYFAKVMSALNRMEHGMRDQLRLILKACSIRSSLVSDVYGFWHSLDDSFLYLVFEDKKCAKFTEKIDEVGYSPTGANFSFGAMGMEICEALMTLHSEGLVLGCLGLGCLGFDEFRHICVDMSGVLMNAHGVDKIVAESIAGKKIINDSKMVTVYFDLLKEGIFVAPEVFLDLLRLEGVVVECDSSRFKVGRRSDVWSLACVLISAIFGTNSIQTISSCNNLFQPDSCLDFSGAYTSWTEKIKSFLENTLGADHVLYEILCKCIDLDPDNRPLTFGVWKSLKYLVSKVQLNDLACLEESNMQHCIALGKISQPKETGDCHDDTRIGHTENEAVQKYITNIDEGIIVGVSLGNFAVANLKGHLDSITGLAVGGGFLFSSSFDKTINVWSLQDYSLVHTFRGHEHRIVALICVEKELPFCISGDSGGGIFIWGITNPFKHEPVRTWYEDKDWRYSGIHALAVHGTEYLYSGSGDKTVKVWSLQDFSLLCKLTGHKSVVSSLAVCHGVLYSGSWDGTVRLWSLNDHSLLTVLGEDMLESGSSVMSLSVYDDVLVVCQENGCIKIWKKDVFKRSLHVHKGAVFAVCLDAKCLFSGGWDRVVHVQELLDDSGQMDVRSVGLVSPESVITALVCWQGKLLVGCADKLIKAYYYYS
uniref:Uncharacterized protein n=1 Tax=Kalanchoe fedtschenkoi TaxID=63787 RepID=A0A7N0TLS0_KALFE